ncbi:MAG: GatB/YqeY domain-containing protein [Chloroflexi bacterium]|nr:GatB/YqeY domain-containing protein [Chloroflexota bacterium]
MDTRAKLQQALKDAMRQKDDLRKRTIRSALAALKLAEVEAGGALDEQAQWAVLQKEIKMRREAIEGAQKAGRDDLIAEAQAEIAVLQEFLPPALDDEALEALAREAIAEVGATSMREMGKVMAVLMPRVQGRATGGQVSQVVRRLLQQNG